MLNQRYAAGERAQRAGSEATEGRRPEPRRRPPGRSRTWFSRPELVFDSGDPRRWSVAVAVALLDNNTNKVSAAKREGRSLRYELRDGLHRVTADERVQKCGRCRVAPLVEGRLTPNGAYFSGIASCGRIWLCPVCAAKVSARRAEEVSAVLAAHLAAKRGGEFLTLTLPHQAGDRLEKTRRLAADGWKRVQQGRGWLALKTSLGIVGTIRALEVTVGKNGWHPHVHVIILTARPLVAAEREALRSHAFAAWRTVVVRAGQAAPLPAHTTIQPVTTAKIGEYATKFGAALELTHGQTKTARGEHRTPFEMLRDFLSTGDEADLLLWQEWERGMRGAKQLTWSRGLKARYAVEEKSDEALAAEEVGGDVVVTITPTQWRALVRLGLRVRLLEALEDGGERAAEAMLASLPP